MTSTPLVSFIIASYNAKESIETTLESIIDQTYSNIEIIVIDGGSTDGTIDIIKKYSDHIAYWVSEKDQGISDAFNKGIRHATGTYINFQGAGDQLLSSDVVGRMMKDVDPQHDMLICGRVQRTTQDGTVLFTTKPTFKKTSLLFRMSLPHQALFTNKAFFETYGMFDVNNRYCMDYELLLRAYKTFPPVVMKDVLVSAWMDGGVGSGKIREVYKEYDRIKRKHRVAHPVVLYMINTLILLKHYIKQLLFINT